MTVSCQELLTLQLVKYSECASGKETTEHLLHCGRYRKHTEEMLDQLRQLRDKNDKVLRISETQLLAPQFDIISKRCSRIIKELFEFISGTSRAL